MAKANPFAADRDDEAASEREAEKLKRTARDWKFNPARDLATNRPVAVFYDVTFTL